MPHHEYIEKKKENIILMDLQFHPAFMKQDDFAVEMPSTFRFAEKINHLPYRATQENELTIGVQMDCYS